MSSIGPIEIRKDALGQTFYASRNYNDLSQTYAVSGANRHQLDWNMTLRQQRRKMPSKDNTRSAPTLGLDEHLKSKAPKDHRCHEDGVYHSSTDTVGKYQNYAASNHMTSGLTRVSSGQAHQIDWQMNLRDGLHQKADDKWRRHHTRSQASFDMMAENCAASNQAYQTSHITPQDRRMDRNSGAMPIASIRDEPMNFRRNPGCEGTQVGQWEHLITCRRYGHKARRTLGHETTLRQPEGDNNGAKIDDTRSDGCIIEMLGKKKWHGHTSPDFLSAPPPDGDAKLYHLSRHRIQAEPDEEDRARRMKKQPRTDANLSWKHTGSMRKSHQGEDS